MRVGVIGSGKMGSTLAEQAGTGGHEVRLANSRGPETLGFVMKYMPELVLPATVEDAVDFGEVVVLAVPFGDIGRLSSRWFKGKVVVDVTNYDPVRDGTEDDVDRGVTTSSEVLAAHLPAARVVKGFNTINWRHLLVEPAPPGPDRRAIPIAGDDPEAKQIVARLMDDMGFDSVDIGPLRAGAILQPGEELFGPKLSVAQVSEIVARTAGS